LETETPTSSAAAPPSIKGIGAFPGSVEEKTLPPRPVVVAWELAVVGGALCLLRPAVEARGGTRCRIRPLPQLVQEGDVLCVLLFFYSSMLGSMVEAASAWDGDGAAFGP
jgi:hypothetical protein